MTPSVFSVDLFSVPSVFLFVIKSVAKFAIQTTLWDFHCERIHFF